MTLPALLAADLHSAMAAAMLAAQLSGHDRRLRLFLITTVLLLVVSAALTLRLRRQLTEHRREEEERRRAVTFAGRSSGLHAARDPWAAGGLPEVGVPDLNPPAESWLPQDLPPPEPAAEPDPGAFTVSWWDDPEVR